MEWNICRKYAQLEVSDDEEASVAELHPAPTTAGVTKQQKQKHTRRKAEPAAEEPVEAAITVGKRRKRDWEENSGVHCAVPVAAGDCSFQAPFRL